jgi:acetylornithine/N-succinyldiaminopimelate aminotransferase
MNNSNHQFIVNSHLRNNVQFTNGKGVYLYGDNGVKYLDFMSGVAVNSLGHCNKIMTKAITKQAKKLWHVSNIFYSNAMDKCAETLCSISGMKKVFFCNSGSEAVETAIKMMRKYFQEKGEYKYEIITMRESFHGRSITNISASQEPAYTNNFYPLLDGFMQVEYGNIDALKQVISSKTAGILLEPIQGEGGLNFAGWEYLRKVSEIAKENNILLALDEVQCGASRLGKFNAFQWAGIQPDIIAMAKGIGGGFPIGATLFAESTQNVITVGSHGTTFGGNPLATAVANAVCMELSQTKFMENVNRQAEYLAKNLIKIQEDFPDIIKEIRGFGLMTGFMLHEKYNAKEISDAFFANNLITTPARNNVIRLLPPLIIKQKHIDEAIKIIRKTFAGL